MTSSGSAVSHIIIIIQYDHYHLISIIIILCLSLCLQQEWEDDRCRFRLLPRQESVITLQGQGLQNRFFFLSDPSPIILLSTLVTHWLTHSCLVDLIDVTMVCEDSNPKLVEVVTVADIDAEKHIDDNLVQIWKLKFGHKVKVLFKLWTQSLDKF